MTNMKLRARAQALRREELRRIASAVGLKWSTLKDSPWHAPARNPLPASPATLKG